MKDYSLLINLSFDYKFVEKSLKGFGNEYQAVLDFSGIFPLGYPHLTYARELDIGNKCELQSIKNLVDRIGEVSTRRFNDFTTFRDLKVNELPVIWLTPLAEKHPSKHWAPTLFFFLEFWKEKSSHFCGYKNYIIIADVPLKVLKVAISSQFPSGKVVNFISKNGVQLPKYNIFSLLLFSLKLFRTFLNFKETLKKVNNQLDYLHVTLSSDEIKINNTQHTVYNFLQSQGRVIFLNPSFRSYPRLNMFSEVFRSFFYCFINTISLERRILSQIAKIKKFSSQLKSEDWLEESILKEISEVLNNRILFHYHNYFRRIFFLIPKNCKVIYDNELYVSGRLISNAATSVPGLSENTIGYQHGHISLNHTVYCVGDKELENLSPGYNDGLPFPYRFLMWGEYYRDLFFRFNSLNIDRIKVAGSLKHYMALNPKSGVSSHGVKNSNELRILWCTTSIDQARFEFSLIKKALLKVDHWSVEIRMHPSHLIKSELESIIDNDLLKKINFTNLGSVEDQMKGKDLIFCSYASTIFLDCLNLNLPVIRIATPSFISLCSASREKIPWTAYSEDDVVFFINFLRSNKGIDFKKEANQFLFGNALKGWSENIA